MKHAYLEEEHHIFRDAFRKFLEKEAYPHYNRWEKDGIIPRSFWRKVGENGFLCPVVEEKYGGAEADFGYSVVINEELEKVGSSLVGIGLHNDIVVPYLTAYGTEEQKKRWLPKCVSGEYITAIAMTEPGAGSDLAAIRTTARKEGDHYIVNGEKTFITNGIHADLVVVVCKTDTTVKPAHKGISLLVLEIGMEGFKRGRKLEKVGLHSQDTAELIFEDVKVPASNLLGEEGKGFYYLMDKLQQERLVVAIAVHLLECMRMYEEGIGSKEEIDKAIKLGLNYPIGPFELADYVGLDTMLFASQGLSEAFGDRFRAPQTLVKLVEAGHLGRKTGNGFYNYEKGKVGEKI